MKLLIFVLLFFALFESYSQKSQRCAFTTSEAVINVEELADPKVVFLFDEFQPATIYFSNKTTEHNINYNLLIDEFIVKKSNSTKRYKLGNEFDSLIVNNMTFIYDLTFGFLEKVYTKNDLTYYIKYHTSYSMEEIKEGAYGQASSSSAVQSVDVLEGRSGRIAPEAGSALRLENSSRNEVKVTLKFQPTLGFIKNNEFIALESRRDLRRNFSLSRGETRSFVRKNNIKFNNRSDLLKVVDFINSSD